MPPLPTVTEGGGSYDGHHRHGGNHVQGQRGRAGAAAVCGPERHAGSARLRGRAGNQAAGGVEAQADGQAAGRIARRGVARRDLVAERLPLLGVHGEHTGDHGNRFSGHRQRQRGRAGAHGVRGAQGDGKCPPNGRFAGNQAGGRADAQPGRQTAGRIIGRRVRRRDLVGKGHAYRARGGRRAGDDRHGQCGGQRKCGRARAVIVLGLHRDGVTARRGGHAGDQPVVRVDAQAAGQARGAIAVRRVARRNLYGIGLSDYASGQAARGDDRRIAGETHKRHRVRGWPSRRRWRSPR